MKIAQMILKVLNIFTLRPVIRVIIKVSKILAIRLDPICEPRCHLMNHGTFEGRVRVDSSAKRERSRTG